MTMIIPMFGSGYYSVPGRRKLAEPERRSSASRYQLWSGLYQAGSKHRHCAGMLENSLEFFNVY